MKCCWHSAGTSNNKKLWDRFDYDRSDMRAALHGRRLGLGDDTRAREHLCRGFSLGERGMLAEW